MLSKDPTPTTLKVQHTLELPKVVVATETPSRGSLALNTPDEHLYYADGTVWHELVAGDDQLVGDTVGPLDGSVPNTVVAIQHVPVSAAAPAAGQALTYNGAAWAPASLASDVTGALTNNTVARIRNFPVVAGAPAANQFLVSNGVAWAPTTLATITKVHEDFCQGAVAPELPPGTVPNQFARFVNKVNIIQGSNANFGIYISRDYVKTMFPGLTMCSLIFQIQVSDDNGGNGGYTKVVNDADSFQGISSDVTNMIDVAYPAPLATGLSPTIVSDANSVTPGSPTTTTGFVAISGLGINFDTGFLYLGVSGTLHGWSGTYCWSV